MVRGAKQILPFPRAAVLFEMLLSLSLFAGAAAFTLAAVRSAFHTLDQTRRRQEAVDLARSRMGELEAGLISLADLRGGARDSRIEGWTFDIKSSRTSFRDLTLVELTVHEDAEAASSGQMSYTLRQLVMLRGENTPDESQVGGRQ